MPPPSEPVTDDVVVTALVPVRAHDPAFLRAAIWSLLDQTDPRWRALVIRDEEGPPFSDEVRGVLEDERITILTNRGTHLAGALNTGMQVASTPFVAILLGDDLWSPDAVAVLRRAIEEDPAADVVHSARRVVDADGRAVGDVHPVRHDIRVEDFLTAAPAKHLLCWRRSMGLEVGGMDESIRFTGPDDFDFPWTLAEHGARFHAVDECLYLYRDHRGHERLSIDVPRSIQVRELRRIFAKHRLPRDLARRRIRQAKGSYLRQCRYRNRLHRRLALLARVGQPASS